MLAMYGSGGGSVGHQQSNDSLADTCLFCWTSVCFLNKKEWQASGWAERQGYPAVLQVRAWSCKPSYPFCCIWADMHEMGVAGCKYRSL